MDDEWNEFNLDNKTNFYRNISNDLFISSKMVTVINNILNWMRSYIFNVDNEDNNNHKDINENDHKDIEIRNIISIDEIPKEDELILYLPPKGYDSYGILAYYNDKIDIKSKMYMRRHKDYFLIIINGREILWETVNNILYTDDKNDINYWSDDIRENMIIKSCKEFSLSC